jgi:iron complex outermembrane receptor protein
MRRMRPDPRPAPVIALFLCLLAPLAPPARGQDQPATPEILKHMSLEDLSKIEVTTTTKEASDAFRSPAAIYVLTREDIIRSGVNTLPDLLRLIPAVEVAQISSDKWAIGIRGFQGYLSKAVLVLIDGRSVYTPLFAGVYWEMQDTLIDDIERIEVIAGPGATIWGANAVNGVINIITRNARDTRGTRVSVGGGNVDQATVTARYGGGDDRLAYRVWGKGFTRGPQYHPDGRNFDDWRRGMAGMRLDWAPNERDAVTVLAGAYGMDAGNRINISTFNPPALVTLQGTASFSGQHVVGEWRRKVSSTSDILLRGYFDRTDRQDLTFRETRNTVDLDFIHHTRRGAHDLISGVGLHVSPSEFRQIVPSLRFLPDKDTYSIYSGFFQDSVTLVPNRLTAVIGTKVQSNSYSGFEIQPSGRLAWTPGPEHTFWAAVTRAVRTPSRIEEGFNFSSFSSANRIYIRLNGDGRFEPERLVGYEAGYRAFIRKAGFVAVNGFYNRYDNLLSVESRPIFAETTPEPTHLVLPLDFRNGVAAQTKGFEVSSLWDLRGWWRVRGSYSHLHLDAARYPTSNDASTVGQLQGDTPQHKVVIQSDTNLGRLFDLGLTFRYVSAIPNQRVPGYSTGDVRLARRLGREFELSVTGRNLFQPHHPEYGTLPGPLVEIRRAVFLKLVWTK